jgi:hypothetical protein
LEDGTGIVLAMELQHQQVQLCYQHCRY